MTKKLTVMKRRDSYRGWEKMSVESKTRKILKRLVRIFRELTEANVLQWVPEAQGFGTDLTNTFTVRMNYFHIWPGVNGHLQDVFDLKGKDVKDLIQAVHASRQASEGSSTKRAKEKAA